MWNVIIVILSVMVVINALLLIGLILIQQSKSGGLSGSFGGAGQDIFGGEASSHIVKFTVFFTTSFFILTLALAIVTGRRQSPKSAVETVTVNETTENNKKAESAANVSGAPAGTIVKKVKGGTITMTPVAGPSTVKTPPPKKTTGIKVTPKGPKSGTIVKKVKGGTITMTPVNKTKNTSVSKTKKNTGNK